MRRFAKGVLATILVIACAVLALKGSVLVLQSGSWSQTGILSNPRVGASAATLPNGRILFAGGDSGNGPTASADSFNTDGTISAAPPMMYARSKHVSVALQDGRVLVAGGLTTGGVATNTAEIFDPVANSWTSVALGMTEARSGATAAVLQDGRVLVAGGQNGTAISSTLEIFDPVASAFSAAGMMSSPRSQHAMAVLQDGRVLIVGGNNGTAPVASTSIFDPVAGTVSAGPALNMARYGHSATTLLNGMVVVIGGNNGNAVPAQMDVTPAELFDPTTGKFSTLATNLTTPREGHLAILLPNNNSVLIAGGTSAGTAVASAELFTPQESAQGVWTYGFGPTGAMTTARSGAAGSANQISVPSTTMQRNGIVAVAGGSDANGNALNTTEAYGYPTVQTDQSDYPPGTTVTITGNGFQAGEMVTIELVESPLVDTHGPYTVQADANGNFVDTSFATDEHDLNIRFYLTATGQTSGFQAQNTFTDNKTLDITFTGAGAGSVAVSDTTTPMDSITCTSSSNPCNVTTANSDVGTLTATASSGSAFAGWSAQSAGVTGCSGNTCNFSMTNTGQSVTATFNLNKLAITSVNGGTNPTAGTPFSVVVQSQDGNGNPLNVTANTGVTLSVNTGTGTLGGTLTGTITAGNNTVTISGVTYTKAQSGVVLTAARTSGQTLAPGNSAAFTVNPGAASQLVFTTQPGGGTAGTAWTAQPVVTLEDANGNTVTGTAQNVILAIQNNAGGGSLSGTTTVAVNTSTGVATFSGLSINKVGTGYTLTATGSTVDTTAGTVISNGFNITAGAATQLVFAQQPTNTAAGSSITPAVTVEDANGNVVTSSTASIAMAIGTNPGSGTLSGTTPVSAVNGVATFSNLSINKTGTGYTLAASSSGLTGATSTTFNVTPGAANKLAFSQQPTNTAAGQSITPAITVQVEDANGNVVTSSTASIAMAIGTNPGSGTLSGTTPVSAVNGVATFSNLSINKTGAGYTLAASSNGLTGATSNTFNITAGTATQLAFGTQPSNTAAGSSITPAMTVQVEDTNGNVVTTGTGSTASVTVAIGTNPGGGTLSGTTTVSAVSGVATFSTLSTNKAGTGYTLTASSSGLTGATSNGFNITPGAVSAGTSTVVANPTSVTADGATTSTITVTLLDASSNPVTGKTVTLTAGSGSSTISAASGASNASGVVTFTVKDTKAETVTYTAKDTTDSVTITETATVTFTPGAAAKVAFGQQPTNAPAGSSIAPAVTVQVEDANGNVLTSGTDSNASITIGIGANPGSGTLSGTLTQTAVNGVATFSNLSINKTGNGYTLTAGSNGLTGATSNTFNITPGTATQLVFGTQPSNTGAGSSITPAVTVQVEDANNNVVTTSTASVTMAIGTNPGGGTLGGTTSVNAVNGVATFGNLSINKTGTGYTLAASSTGLTGATSNAFNITPGAASKVVFSQQPTNTQAGSSITPAVTVQVEDANNNLVTTSTASITVAIGTNPGSGTPSGTLTQSAVNGIATFGNLSINKTGTGYTLTANSTGLTGATSTSFNITPGTASKLAFNVQPSTTTAGQAISPAVTVQVQDANGNVVTTDTSSVTIAISSGGAFSAGSTLTVAASSGVATFSNLVPTVAGSFTLSASDGSLTSATSNSFTVNAGALSKFVFSTITSPQTAGTAFNVTVTAEDANGNTVTNYNADGNNATLTSTGTLVGAPIGTASFTKGVLTQSVTITNTGSFTITVTGNPGQDNGAPPGTSNSFTVNPGAVNSGTSTVSANPTSVPADGSTTSTITVTLKDANNNPVSGKAASLTAGSGSSSITTVSGTTNASGQATFTVKDGVGEVVTYSAKDTTDIVTITQTAAVTFTNPAPTLSSISPTSGNLSQTLNVIFTGTNFITGVSSVNVGGADITVNTTTVNSATQITANLTIASNATVGARNFSVTNSGPGGGTSATQTFTVNNPTTTTTLGSSPNPSTYGQSVTFTATVTSGGGTPTGSVTFYNSATCSGTALASSVSVNSSGQASFSTAQLAAGSPTITACYSPTGIYLASNGSVSQIVNAAAASISLSAPTVIYPANSVVTVTVSSSAGTPTGNATLVVDGGMPVFAALNGSGVAAFTLTSPSPGGHSLSASYAAQGNFAASGPTAGTLTVDEVPTIASANNTTFTAAVAGSFTVTTVAFPTANLGETGTLPVGVSFTDNGDGTATLAGTATVAGSYPLTITAANGVGQAVQMFTLTVSPGAFAQLQLLVAGETAAPGTTSGKTGTPNTEYVNGAFNVTVNAVDANWNVVNMVTDTVQITSSDAKAVLPANGPLTLGTGTFSVTLETPENPAATTITASDYTDNNKTSDTSPKIEVIVVYTATISPADWATGQQATYTLTVNNAAAPNTNNLASVEIAVPSADQGTIGNVSVSAAQSGGASANWSYDSSMLLPGTMRFFETTANDAVTPGGTITITFTATSNATVSTIPVYEVWSTTAFSDAASHNALPLAPPEPTVSIGAAPAFTSASSTSAFTYGTPGTIFAVTTTGVPTPSLSKTGSFPSWAAFKDNGDGTATISGTPTAAGMSTFTITAHNGFGPDATQTFTLTLNKATVTPSITASNKVYDGTTTASVTCTLAGVVGMDNVTCSAASANFSQAGVGTGLTVTATGITLGGAAAGNYQLSSTMATTAANITARPITATLTAQNKTYDGTNTEPNANMRCSLMGVLSGDNTYVSCAATSGTFNTSQVATANLVTATVTISGAAGNYTLGAAGTSTTSTSATATAHITAVAASVTPNAASKTYGTADPAFTGTLTGFLAADGVTATYSRTAGEVGSPGTELEFAL